MKNIIIRLAIHPRLRVKMERTINDTWYHVQKPQNQKTVDQDIQRYKNLKKIMVETGIPQEDISDYDKRFTNLPWRHCGYQIPRVE